MGWFPNMRFIWVGYNQRTHEQLRRNTCAGREGSRNQASSLAWLCCTRAGKKRWSLVGESRLLWGLDGSEWRSLGAAGTWYLLHIPLGFGQHALRGHLFHHYNHCSDRLTYHRTLEVHWDVLNHCDLLDDESSLRFLLSQSSHRHNSCYLVGCSPSSLSS